MATLIPKAFVDGTKSAFVWQCSDCDAVFSLDKITANPSLTQLQIVNANFGVHCHHEHARSPVFGLAIPAMYEDVAQAAFRVLREATKGK
jgi:hypothetical protein